MPAPDKGVIDKIKALITENPDNAPGELPVGTMGASTRNMMNDKLYEMEHGRKRAAQSTDKANGY